MIEKDVSIQGREDGASRVLATLNTYQTATSLLGKAQEFDSATLQVVKVDGHDNKQADSDLQVEGVDAEQVASVGKQSHDDSSQNGTDGTALCSRQAGTADDCTSNGLQLIPGSCSWNTRAKSRSR